MAGAMAEMITGAMTGILSCSSMFFLLFPDNFRQGIHFIIERFHVGVNIVDMLLQFNNFFEHFCHQKSFCFLGFCLHWCFFCHDRIGYFYFWCIYSRPKYFRQKWWNWIQIGFGLGSIGLGLSSGSGSISWVWLFNAGCLSSLRYQLCWDFLLRIGNNSGKCYLLQSLSEKIMKTIITELTSLYLIYVEIIFDTIIYFN